MREVSKDDAKAMDVPRDVVESLWNKCAMCVDCNQAEYGGYGARSMSPSTYCTLVFTQIEAQNMINFGPKGPVTINPTFYRVYTLLRQRFVERSREAA